MPGNDLGDTVHNFFAQDNSLGGLHHSQVAEGNWPVLNSNFWVGGQRQIDQLDSNGKNYNSQSPDVDRGEASYPLNMRHGLNFTQSNMNPDFARSQSLNEQPNLNGFMYANQFHQTRQNQAHFLGMDTDSDHRHIITSRGLSLLEVQHGGGPDHQAKASVRSETSVSPVSFDLFSGQQQISQQQSGTTQPLQHQQSGINGMQHLQHQLMMRKMQELQWQQQLHNLSNQVPSAKQTSGSQSTLVNGTPNTDALQYPWTAELGTNGLNWGSPSMQGSPSGLGFPPNLGQTQRLVDLVPQQVDHSLYGVPISSSRDLKINHHPQVVTDRASTPQKSTSSNFLHGSEHNLLPEQLHVQDESSMARHKFQNDNMFGLASKQSPSSGLRNLGGLQQVSSVSRNAPQQENSHGKPNRQVASPRNEVALDPTEEKILFGSDGNIWAAFGKVPHVSREASNVVDSDGSNGLPSIQSGSWSALMQSALAETSSSDIAPQEEWSGLIFQTNNSPSWSQPLPLPHDSCKQETSIADNSMQMPSALSSGSILPFDDISNNVMELNQHRQKSQNGHGQRLHTEVSQMFFQSLGEADKGSNQVPLENSVAEGSQTYRDASPNSLQAERNTKTLGLPRQSGTRIQSNGWNALVSVLPGGDSVIKAHGAENLQRNSQNNQVGVKEGEVVYGSSSWKLNSIPSSTVELSHVKPRVGKTQANHGILSLKDSASVAKSHNAGTGDETSPFVQNTLVLSQSKNVHPPSGFQMAESLGRSLHQANDPNQVLYSLNRQEKDEVARYEMKNNAVKENSNDTNRSNLSQHSSGGFREGGLSDATDLQPFPMGKEKPTKQLPRKASAPRKFQYHPMGNVDEDVEPAYGLKQPNTVPAMSQMSQNNGHLGQSKLYGQVTRNSTLVDKGLSFEVQKDTKSPDEGPSRGNLSGYMPNVLTSCSQPIDTDTLNNASSSSQNMLELFNKVDQSKSHGAMMQFSSVECNSSSQLPDSDKCDKVGRLQHSQSSVSQGFGLQLGPPSQRLQVSDHPLSSQNGQGEFNSLYSNNYAAEMGDKAREMAAMHSVQSLPSSAETQAEFKLNTFAIPGHGGNDDSLNKMPGKFASAFSSGIPYSRSNVQNQQTARVGGQMLLNQRIDSVNENASHSAHWRTAGALLPDESSGFQQNNCASSGPMSQQSGPNEVRKSVPSANIPTTDYDQASQHSAMPGISQWGDSAHNLRTNVPVHQQNMTAQFQQMSSRESSQPNIVESSPAFLVQGRVNSQGVDGDDQKLKESTTQHVVFIDTDTVPEVKKSLGKASIMKNHLDDSPAISESMQKNIEAFGRSVKPNNFSHRSYCLSNKVQALKDSEIESCNRDSNRMKGQENVVDIHLAASEAGQLHEHIVVVGDSLGSSVGVLSEDSRMVSFSGPADLFQRNPSQQGNLAPLNSLGLNQDFSKDNSCADYSTSFGVDRQISPQMAPSWFNQYGTIKNGQMPQIYGAGRVTPFRSGEPSFTLGKSSSGLGILNSEEKKSTAPTDACQVSNNQQNSTPLLVANGQFSSPKTSQLNVTGQNLGVLRPKKRKNVISDLHPWHKEITEVSQDLFSHSAAESDWGKATNHFTDKVEDDAELIEDGPLALRSKRRLILTTNLVQKLLRPASAALLSADASTSYEVVAYTISRVVLGDACGTIYCSNSLDVPFDGVDLIPLKGKSRERNRVQCYAKAAGELLGRASKLEDDFFRLDKRASMLDLRVEYQDLEKFSIINRFAKFHGRGQSDNSETSSTDVTSSSQKSIPQRYVTALPRPRGLPDGVQCLPL